MTNHPGSLLFDSRDLNWQVADAIQRNARTMRPREYAWLKNQNFKPPIRVALIAEYERLHGGNA